MFEFAATSSVRHMQLSDSLYGPASQCAKYLASILHAARRLPATGQFVEGDPSAIDLFLIEHVSGFGEPCF